MRKELLLTLALVFGSLTAIPFQSAQADKVCLKFNKKKSKIQKKSVASGACGRGFIEVVDTATLTGPQGTTGSDGALRVWGTGVDGDITISENGTELDPNKQYNNITISAVSAIANSGNTIRCTGTLTISGTVLLNYGPNGGSFTDLLVANYTPQGVQPDPGVTIQAPGSPSCATAGNAAAGGNGGIGFGNGADSVTKAGPRIHAGSGAGSLGGSGGQAGPSIAFYCKGGITITGTGVIEAQGTQGNNGGGGAGGGIVILASNGPISHQGGIDVSGGDGGASSASSCAGGGGGGGLVRFIGASVSNTGTITATGGALGASITVPSTGVRCGGGGGAASFAAGGGAQSVTGGNTCNGGNISGSDGGTITTTISGGNVESLIL